IRQAAAVCPEAVILPPDPVFYRSGWEGILTVLGDFSPEVEDEEMGGSYLNVTGLESYYGDEQRLARCIAEAVHEVSSLTGSIGIACGKLPAFAAATVAAGERVYIVPPGHEAAFLSKRPVELLSVDAGVIARLRLLG